MICQRIRYCSLHSKESKEMIFSRMIVLPAMHGMQDVLYNVFLRLLIGYGF